MLFPGSLLKTSDQEGRGGKYGAVVLCFARSRPRGGRAGTDKIIYGHAVTNPLCHTPEYNNIIPIYRECYDYST